MHEMKGIARTIMVGQSKAQGRVELARFADGSWAIRKDGPTVGVWEPHEEAECFRVFGLLTGLGGPSTPGGDGPAAPTVVIVRRHPAPTNLN